jgi:peptidoglycan hydrolase CwlO-like protein
LSIHGNTTGKLFTAIPMRRPPAKITMRPISTMPRPKTEATAFLDLYKLVIEKKRLQQELQSLEQRRQQITNRLAVLDSQVAELENNVQQMREEMPTSSAEATLQPTVKAVKMAIAPSPSDTFDTLFLEY